MDQFIYETHKIQNPQLPFIFHPIFVRSSPCHRINWHENIEFLYCTDGEGYVRCGSDHNAFRKGELFVVNADTIHSIGSDSAVTYQCLIIDQSFFVENGIPVSGLYFQSRICDEETSRLFTAIARAYEAFNESDRFAVAEIRFFVLAFLRQLCRHYLIAHPGSPAHTDPRVKEALVYIRNHFRQPIALDTLAIHTGLSKYHLSRRFKEATGKTIVETVNLTRCTEAKRLIEKGLSVSAAAISSGFDNLSYFSRTYKRLLGELPSAASGKHR